MNDFFIKVWIEHWVKLVITGIISAMVCQYRKHFATQKGVQALLRAELIKVHNKYVEREFLPIYERENIEALHREYKALGGNGIMDDLIEKLYKLPTEPRKER